MAIRMVADAMPRRAPALQDARAFGIVDALADREQKRAGPPQVRQQALFRFGPATLRDGSPPDVIHGDGDPWPRLREQRSGAQNQSVASSDPDQFLTVTHKERDSACPLAFHPSVSTIFPSTAPDAINSSARLASISRNVRLTSGSIFFSVRSAKIFGRSSRNGPVSFRYSIVMP